MDRERERKKIFFFFFLQKSRDGIMKAYLGRYYFLSENTCEKKREWEREKHPPFFLNRPQKLINWMDQFWTFWLRNTNIFFSCFYRFIFVLMIERKVQFVHVSTHDSKEGKGGVSKLMMVTVFINKVSDLFSIVFGANI